jgi:co-chaperonin GroES (HSP10)|tara:strand:+ start:7885 stop:8400 length:516 start_codon:yes stop_codon:yes gene_type:complete
MSKIQVPDHVAKSIEADLKKEKQTRVETPTEDGGPQPVKENPAYVKESARVLDPTLLEKSLIDRMPQPTGWRILILPYAGKAVTEGGIHLVQSTVDRESLATVVGYVVKMGPDCYADASKFAKPWCQEKQWVLIGRYAGARFKLGDESECRIINDDEVIATILDPDDILAV